MDATVFQEPVNRARRFAFIAVIEAVSIANIMALAYFGRDSTLSIAAIDGFVTLAVGVALAYVGGSAVDYASSMLSGRAATRERARPMASAGVIHD